MKQNNRRIRDYQEEYEKSREVVMRRKKRIRSTASVEKFR
jgi:hypothetical protein